VKTAAKFRSAKGFSLLELAVVMVIVVLLTVLVIGLIRNALEGGYEAKSSQQARQIVAAVIADSSDRGTFYTREDVGYSSYRSVEDPLGLPAVLRRSGYLKNRDVWWAPGTRPALKKYGNAYAWNRNDSVCGKSVVAMPDPTSIAIFWNNYCYTLPSITNVSEPTTGGPRVASQGYWLYPYRSNKAANFAYADGHVALVYKAEKATPTPAGGSVSTGPNTSSASGGTGSPTGNGSGIDNSGTVSGSPVTTPIPLR